MPFSDVPAGLACVKEQGRSKAETVGRDTGRGKHKHSCDTVRNNVQAFASQTEVNNTTSSRAGTPELRNSLAALTTITKMVDSVVSRSLAAHMLNLH